MRLGVGTGNHFKHVHTKSFSHVSAGLFLPADVYFVFWRGLRTAECEQAIKEQVGGGGNVSDRNTGTCPLGELLLYKIKPLLAMTGEENLLGLFKVNTICWVITVVIKQSMKLELCKFTNKPEELTTKTAAN